MRWRPVTCSSPRTTPHTRPDRYCIPTAGRSSMDRDVRECKRWGRVIKEEEIMAKENSRQPDAVQILKADHKLVKKLFDQCRSASGHEKTRLAGQLFSELTIHATLE